MISSRDVTIRLRKFRNCHLRYVKMLPNRTAQYLTSVFGALHVRMLNSQRSKYPTRAVNTKTAIHSPFESRIISYQRDYFHSCDVISHLRVCLHRVNLLRIPFNRPLDLNEAKSHTCTKLITTSTWVPTIHDRRTFIENRRKVDTV